MDPNPTRWMYAPGSGLAPGGAARYARSERRMAAMMRRTRSAPVPWVAVAPIRAFGPAWAHDLGAVRRDWYARAGLFLRAGRAYRAARFACEVHARECTERINLIGHRSGFLLTA